MSYRSSIRVVRTLFKTRRPCFGALVAVAIFASPTPTMSVVIAGHTAGTLSPGMRFAVTVQGLPARSRPYCLGLASAVDRYGLPVSLGAITRDAAGMGRVSTTIPTRLFPAEPPGSFLLFVGTCSSIAPDRPFLARTIIHIVPSRS